METQHRLINTTFPVELPDTPQLKKSEKDFASYLETLLAPAPKAGTTISASELPVRPKTEDQTERTTNDEVKLDSNDNTDVEADVDNDDRAPSRSAFMDALLGDKAAVPTFDEHDGKMLTENADVAYRTSGEILVDLFFELEDAISNVRLGELLQKAWTEDPESTLRIIWNARSIHLGKSSRFIFYRAVGWLYQNHPATLIANLPWLVHPIIFKKAPKKDEMNDAVKVDSEDVESDFEVIDDNEDLDGQPATKKIKLDDDSELSEFDVKYGVAHGYWKDLLNILAVAVNDELKVDGDPRKILNVQRPNTKPSMRDWTKDRKKAIIEERYQRAVNKLKGEPRYKALHLAVARLFADQLRLDTNRLVSGSKQDIKAITLVGKWAPTHKGMHDQHTFIVSSIAEALHSFEDVCPEADPADRKSYTLYAREAYQLKTLPQLRKHLQIVERSITAEKFEDIKYDRIPSLAMKQYTSLFIKKDFERFEKYIENVAKGKARISGATLLPSTLVHEIDEHRYDRPNFPKNMLLEQKMHEITLKSIGGQWGALVQRIKESGTLQSSIAVCDVSCSMESPIFEDSTCPMDSAIGLSLLLAEITKPPFGGAFITFSSYPQVLRVGGPDDKRSFEEKVRYIRRSKWSMNTDFVAVFRDLILPMAIKDKLKPEDMVKQVFVFSDMHFDHAECGEGRWKSSYERIRDDFKAAGYEMPKLIFWNLAGGRQFPHSGAKDAAPKPVTAAEEGTALVSGYSQAQLKMFLENGQFDDPPEEEMIVDQEGEDGEQVIIEKTKKKQDPLATVRKAISHEAYRMLKVVD